MPALLLPLSSPPPSPSYLCVCGGGGAMVRAHISGALGPISSACCSSGGARVYVQGVLDTSAVLIPSQIMSQIKGSIFSLGSVVSTYLVSLFDFSPTRNFCTFS